MTSLHKTKPAGDKIGLRRVFICNITKMLYYLGSFCEPSNESACTQNTSATDKAASV